MARKLSWEACLNPPGAPPLAALTDGAGADVAEVARRIGAAAAVAPPSVALGLAKAMRRKKPRQSAMKVIGQFRCTSAAANTRYGPAP